MRLVRIPSITSMPSLISLANRGGHWSPDSAFGPDDKGFWSDGYGYDEFTPAYVVEGYAGFYGYDYVPPEFTPSITLEGYDQSHWSDGYEPQEFEMPMLFLWSAGGHHTDGYEVTQ